MKDDSGRPLHNPCQIRIGDIQSFQRVLFKGIFRHMLKDFNGSF